MASLAFSDIQEILKSRNVEISQKGHNENFPKKFKCNLCGDSFSYKHVLQNHKRTHTGEKPFKCEICQKKFTRDHHLKTHERLHTGEKPFACQCGNRFVQVANLRRHEKYCKIKNVRKEVKQNYCGYSSSSPDSGKDESSSVNAVVEKFAAPILPKNNNVVMPIPIYAPGMMTAPAYPPLMPANLFGVLPPYAGAMMIPSELQNMLHSLYFYGLPIPYEPDLPEDLSIKKK